MEGRGGIEGWKRGGMGTYPSVKWREGCRAGGELTDIDSRGDARATRLGSLPVFSSPTNSENFAREIERDGECV